MHNILILGYGNPGRGDDALGPELIRQLEAQKRQHDWPHIELLTEFQLQIENVLDLMGRDLVLLIDANMSCAAPYEIEHCIALCDHSMSSHALSPAALLYIYRQTQATTAPPCYILNIRGNRFDLGLAMSRSAQTNLLAASRFVQRFCHQVQDGDPQGYMQQHRQLQQYA